jgi:tRNA pseudouridine38/39 synthase
VVALHLRSNAKLEAPELGEEQEIDYPAIINKALPEDIRVLGWATAAPDFSAR